MAKPDDNISIHYEGDKEGSDEGVEYVASSDGFQTDNARPEAGKNNSDRNQQDQISQHVQDGFDDIRVNGEVGMREEESPPHEGAGQATNHLQENHKNSQDNPQVSSDTMSNDMPKQPGQPNTEQPTSGDDTEVTHEQTNTRENLTLTPGGIKEYIKSHLPNDEPTWGDVDEIYKQIWRRAKDKGEISVEKGTDFLIEEDDGIETFNNIIKPRLDKLVRENDILSKGRDDSDRLDVMLRSVDDVPLGELSDEVAKQLTAARGLQNKYSKRKKQFADEINSRENLDDDQIKQIKENYKLDPDKSGPKQLAYKYKHFSKDLFKEAETKEDLQAFLTVAPAELHELRKLAIDKLEQIESDKQGAENDEIERAFNQAMDVLGKAEKKLVKGPDGDYWHMSWVEKKGPKPYVKLYESGVEDQGQRIVPLITDEGQHFAERYSPITDQQKAHKIANTSQPEGAESSTESAENSESEKVESESSPKIQELEEVYNRVGREKKELLKRINYELANSGYKVVERLRKKLSEDPASVLRAISGIEGSGVRESGFPKYEVLQTLGSIERLNGEVVSREDVENMVTAGYDSEWDVWQRIKTNHVYEMQNGTVFVNLSGDKNGLWTKFEDMQTYRKYKDPEKEGKPIGRKRGIGGMLEYIEKDIDKIKESAKSTEQTKTNVADISPGDMVMLTEKGSPRWSEYHAVEDMMENNDGELLIRTDKGSAYWPIEKFKLDSAQNDEGDTAEQSGNSENNNESNAETTTMLTQEEIRGIIHDSDSPDQAVREILQEDTLFWKEDQKAVREGQKWIIYSDTVDSKIDELSHEEMKHQAREAIIEMNEKNKHKIDTFVDNVFGSVNKIIQALPEDESSDDEEGFKAEYQKFRNNIVADNNLLSRQEVKRYRDRFVQLMHYYKNERSELWHRSEAVYRTDVKEAVAGIDQILENSPVS